MTARRGLTVAVLVCAAGAGLALLAASRGWGEVTQPRPAPLPPLVETRTGPRWLSALALVALAGSGALPATRGLARQAVGVLLVTCGAGLMIGAVVGVSRAGADPGWPVLCALAGVVVAAVGGLTVRRGRSWPTMGTRYERSPERAAARSSGSAPTEASLWDAIDRGEDPTR